MKFFKTMKDGGQKSRVVGYWLVEIKCLFSIVLLKFEGPSRDAFHTHAFNALSWVLKGFLVEKTLGQPLPVCYKPSLLPVYTPRDKFHKVDSVGTTWVLSFRGPWCKTWMEYLPSENRFIILTHGRKEVAA